MRKNEKSREYVGIGSKSHNPLFYLQIKIVRKIDMRTYLEATFLQYRGRRSNRCYVPSAGQNK